MNKFSAKILSLMLIVALAVTVIAGCGSSTKESTQETTAASSSSAAGTAASSSEDPNKIDTSKEVELQFYMVGDAPKDLDVVSQKINELAKKDINATVKFNFTTWTDFDQKYNLLLSSGEPVDLIYTATWLNYFKLANAGAFLPLDDLLPKYAPELNKFIGEEMFNQVKANGKIYTMPSTWKEYINDGLTYRKDLQQKLNLPEPNSLENVEAYFEGIKKNMPQQIITNETAKPGADVYSFTAFEILSMKYKWVNVNAPYGLVADYATPGDIKPYWGSQDFIDDMKMFKRWADKGFWSRSALSAKVDATSFTSGKVVAVIQGENPNKYADSIMKVESSNPDWEVGYYPYCYSNGVAIPVHPAQNGYGIPIASKNPERAMMFYEKLVMDKTYNQLTQYGIEGTHYKVENGYYVPIGDVTKSGFAREGMNGWAWRNPDYMLYDKSFDTVKNLFKEYEEKYPTINYMDGFAEDYSAYQSERAALATVMSQYLAPLQAGLVKDVDAAVATFMEKAKAAGLDKIQAEYTRQWKAYIQGLGIK